MSINAPAKPLAIKDYKSDLHNDWCPGCLAPDTLIVTPEGKNVIPEDIESVFKGLPVKEFCVFAANYIWPRRSMTAEQLIIAIQLENGQSFTEQLKQDIIQRNNRLLNFKRVHGMVLCEDDFPVTASLKIKRNLLAQRLSKLDRDRVILPL